MTLLDNKNKRREYYDNSNHGVPKVFRPDDNSISLKSSILLSAILHPAVIIFGWLLVFIMALMGVNFALFKTPEPKMKDIEFILVDKEATPINKNTKFRSDKNSRAGGIHDPSKRISSPSTPSPKVMPQQKAGGSPPPKQVAPKKSANQQMVENMMKQRKVEKQQAPVRRGTPTAKPTETPPMVPKPIPRAGNPPTVAKPTTPFAVPVPKANYSAPPSASQGPVSGSPSGTGSRATGSGSGSGGYKPSPSLSTSGAGAGKSGSGRFSAGYSSGSGAAGNPSPGNPKGAPGIDALREPDFGPYMRDLQRRIKSNWDPPSGNESKRVVLLFKVSRDGRLLSVKVNKSSGLSSADRAAISAVELSAPFKQLPPEFKGASVDIQFTFDYNVFGGSIN